MFANMKQFKGKIKKLQLPWWFNLAKWGIPYTIAALTAIAVMCTLGGWVAIPESVQMLQWLVALFSTMQPVVKFLAVGLSGLGTFLSSLLMSSIFVRGILFYYVEKAAVEGEKISTDLFEQNKELQLDIHKAGELHDQTRDQLAFLKGFSTAKANKVCEDSSQEPETEEVEVDQQTDFNPQTSEKPLSVNLPEASEPVLIFSNRPAKALSASSVLQEEPGEKRAEMRAKA